MRNLLQNIVLVSFIILLAGCSVTVKATKIVPAEAGDVTQYKTVAVLDFKGNKGREVASDVEALISKAEVNNRKVYTVVDRDNINRILNEQKFQMTMANEESIVNFGELIGAEAIWSGFAESNYNTSISYETRSKCSYYRDGKCMGYINVSVPCERRSVSFKASPKLTSVSTGKVIYTKIFEGTESSYACKDDSYGWMTESQLFHTAERKFLAQLRLDIAPYAEEVTLSIMTKKDGTNKSSAQYLTNGIAFIKENRTEKACELWEKGLNESPDAVSLIYNLGVCAELAGNYEKAVKLYEKAEDVSGRPVNEISNAIERNKINIENQKKLKSQM